MSTWAREEDRLLLLELVVNGAVIHRRSQESALQHLSDLRWVRRPSRSPRWELEVVSRGQVEALLDRVWPEWRLVRARLEKAGLPPTMAGWTTLRDRERMAAVRSLPPVLHSKTYAAAVGAHSKVGLSRRHAREDGGPLLTSDQVARLRPSPGLLLRQGAMELDASALARLNGGEVVLTERALLAGTELVGKTPAAVLFVENLGAYLDLAPPEGWLVVHVPGWDSSLVRHLVPTSAAMPLVHFGDLDPEGVRITAHLRTLFPRLHWFVPSFAPEYFPDHALPCEWPSPPIGIHLPPPVAELAGSGRWLEQEVLALDERCFSELATFRQEESPLPPAW